MPSTMRQFFSKSKGSPAQSPDSDAFTPTSAACTCACHGCATQTQRLDNTTAPSVPERSPTPTSTPADADAPGSAATPLATPSPAATPLVASAPSSTESFKSHSTTEKVLNGASITLSVLEGVGAVAPVPFLKNVAQVTKTLVDLIQGVLQNDKTLRELIQEAIALGRCIIDAVNMCFTPGEPLPDVFQQHIMLLLDTLKEVKDLCLHVLRESKLKKTLQVNVIKDKAEAHRRRIKGGLDYFQVRSNISVEAHFAKWTKLLEERFPLNGFTLPPTPVQNVDNTNNSRTFTANAPVNMHSFVCGENGVQMGQGNQFNMMGMDSSLAARFDPQALQEMVRSMIPQIAVPARG